MVGTHIHTCSISDVSDKTVLTLSLQLYVLLVNLLIKQILLYNAIIIIMSYNINTYYSTSVSLKKEKVYKN